MASLIIRLSLRLGQILLFHSYTLSGKGIEFKILVRSPSVMDWVRVRFHLGSNSLYPSRLAILQRILIGLESTLVLNLVIIEIEHLNFIEFCIFLVKRIW